MFALLPNHCRYRYTYQKLSHNEGDISTRVLPLGVNFFLYVSSCPAHVTLSLSSVVFHRPSFLRVQPTVICSSSVSLSSSSTLPSLPLTPPFFACLLSLLLLFFGPSCFRTLAACVVVRSEPRFPLRTGVLV